MLQFVLTKLVAGDT